jgi:hypothetical protein
MILDGEQSHVERVGEREGELRQCAGCGNKIHDKYLLQVTFLSRLYRGNFLDPAFKGTVRPDWIYMRVLPLDKP